MDYFRKILDSIGDEVIALREGQTIQWINKAFCQRWRVDLPDVREQCISDILPGVRLAKALRKRRAFNSRLYTVCEEEYPGKKSGPIRYLASYLPGALPVGSRNLDVLVLSPSSGSPSRGVGTHARLTFDDIVGVSQGVRQAIRTSRLAARKTATVLILGDSGVGKDVFAQAIHSERGANRPFVAVNCAALPRELMESELFGYTGGSFTGAAPGGRPGKFELADGGTIFLDEIGELPLALQPKLLRVLQTKEVIRIGAEQPKKIQVKVIAATKQNLEQRVKDGSFRDDLFYRLNVITMKIPPLRDRRKDIPFLVKHFLAKICESENMAIPDVAEDVMEALTNCMWPGNIRQLENVLEREILYLPQGKNVLEHIPDEVLRNQREGTAHAARTVHNDSKFSLKNMEKHLITQALKNAEGNLSSAARLLGISRATLYRKMEKQGLTI